MRKRYVGIRLSEEEIEKLKEIAERDLTTVSSIIWRLVVKYLRGELREKSSDERKG